MKEKIDKEITALLKNLQSEEEIPVIVTVKPNMDKCILENKGLKINMNIDDANILGGTISSEKIKEFSKLDVVKKIEYDGKMYATE